jgi:hypothetical protein
MTVSKLRGFLQSPVVITFLALNTLLVFAYRSPKNSYFLVHDYLDHMFVLYKLRGDNPHFFDYSASFFGVLGGIPLSALGISDFSLDANLFVFLDPYLAAVVNEFTSRNIAFFSMCTFLFKLVPGVKKEYAITAPALLFALLPYYPNFSLTIAFLPIVAFVVLLALSESLKPVHYLLILATSLFSNFTYGGFALVGVLVMTLLVQIFRRKFFSSAQLFVVTLILMCGYLVGISRILILKLRTDFESHRLSWVPLNEGWFDPSTIPVFVQEFAQIVLRGVYHFPSGQSILASQFIPGLPLILLLFYVVFHFRIRSSRGGVPRVRHLENRLVVYFMASIITVSLFYASEASGFTQFEYLMREPFQFKRVAVLLPFLWCSIAALALNSLSRRFARLGTISLLVVIVQIMASNVGVQQKILHFIGYQENHPTIGEYFDSKSYAGLAKELGLEPSEIRVLSFDLDPMIASFNGYDSLDGYVYNYPLQHKEAFRKIIAGELRENMSLKDYYDGWGSRVYLFHRELPVQDIRISWCGAKYSGADYILSKKDLSLVSNLKFSVKYGELKLYKISGC